MSLLLGRVAVICLVLAWPASGQEVVPDPTNPVSYLAPRTDGQPGLGTETDPYDASTAAKLQSVWSTIFGTARSNLSCVFLPGDYFVAPHLYLPTGCSNVSVLGYGAKLWMTNALLSGAELVLGNISGTVNNVTIAGVTVDSGSRVGLTANGKVSGIHLTGTDNRIVDCTVLNTASTNENEAFSILLNGTNGLVRGCLVQDAINQYMTAIAVTGKRHRVVDNRVELPVRYGRLHCYTAYASDTVVSNNVAQGGSAGFYVDWTPGVPVSENVTVINNHFAPGRYGLHFKPYEGILYLNWQIIGNTVITTNAWILLVQDYFEGGRAPWSSPRMGNITFTRNRFYGPVSDVYNFYLSRNPWGVPIATNVVLVGNSFSEPLRFNYGVETNVINLGNAPLPPSGLRILP